ncbi:MAG: hypothetical protein WC496_09585 [Phycisphaerae bacterium]|jgi:hypothetical protein
MTQEDKTYQQKKSELLEEICDNIRAIRRVTNRILDHMHEYNTETEPSENSNYDPDELHWENMDDYDDMFL